MLCCMVFNSNGFFISSKMVLEKSFVLNGFIINPVLLSSIISFIASYEPNARKSPVAVS